jgi:peroxiredoxin
MLKRLLVASLASLSVVTSVTASGLAVGDKLSPFALKDTQGKLVDLAGLKPPKAVVVMFIATRCPVSNAYNSRMDALARDYSGRGILVFGINANRQESVVEIAEHAAAHGFTFPVLKDENNAQADRFGAQFTPEVYVFDPSWTLRYHGRIDDSRDEATVARSDLRLALDAVLAGQPVATPETKAFGCTIKRVNP